VKRKEKILLIGSDGFDATNEDAIISCFSWDQLESSINLRDFDTIVVNLLGLSEETRQRIDWSRFEAIVNFAITRNVLQNNGKILIVGDPRFSLEIQGQNDQGKSAKVTQPFLFWTGLRCGWDNSAGDTVEFRDTYNNQAYSEYVKRLRRWNYSLDRCRLDDATVEAFFNIDYLQRKGWEVDVELTTIVENRYRNRIIFEASIGVSGQGYQGKERKISFGPIIFLPPISVDADETIQIVLRDLCGFQATLPEPKWLSKFKAPGQQHVDDEIARTKGEISALAKRLDAAYAERAKRRECLKLLFEREFELEPAARNILRSLGAHVEDPQEKNKEDGWLTVDVGGKTYEGVLEIKSTRNDQFDEDGRKQLLDWIERGVALRQKNYKGLFFGNSAVNKPRLERPYPFSDSWKRAAELNGICALTTTDLYVIYLLHSQGLINTDDFWTELFECNGVFQTRKYYEALAPKEGT
jgi:hypothetical protein